MLAGPGAAAELPGTFKGYARGANSKGDTGPIAHDFGRLAAIAMPCEGTDGTPRVRSVDSVSIGAGGNFMRANNIRSTIFSDKSTTRAIVRNKSEISQLNLLAGLITADEINAFANVTATASEINVNARGSGFSNLRIAGDPVADDPRPNTEIPLPGLGSATLKAIKAGDGSISVQMIRVEVTEPNEFGLPVGAVIIVGNAKAGFTRAELDRIIDGVADIATSSTGEVNQHVKEGRLGVPCEGTGGETLSKTVVGPALGDTFSAASGKVTAFGGETDVALVVKTTSTIDRANLLDGLIKARELKAVAKDVFRNGTRRSSTAGSQVSGLQIGGLSHGTITAANVQIPIPGVGHVIVNETTTPHPTSRDRTRVNALHIAVTENNSFGLPVGSRVVVGQATSFVNGSVGASQSLNDPGTEERVGEDWDS